jgi:TetR/AcrR family transcriptional regulator, regulator of autoinduction and epiphytic fitness
MNNQQSHFSHDVDDDDVDPRRIRSRNRLLDAAENLLRSGGIEAVTIDAVTKASKVARTTLYRHFSSSSQLRAATFERLLPQVTPPPPASGTLRERLIELLARQAKLLAEAPLHTTTLAWIALGLSTTKTGEGSDHPGSTGTLRARIVDQYREPFEEILQSHEARDELDDFDLELVVCQLIGPVAFARMTELRVITEQDCVRIIDDFLAAHGRGAQKSDTCDSPSPLANDDRPRGTSRRPRTWSVPAD